MSNLIVIIPCGARKQTGKHPAGKLYTGPYYRACLGYALSLANAKNVFILSAKYGLLALTDMIETYNLTMGQFGCVTTQQVYKQAKERGLLDQTVIAVGGRRYTDICRYVWCDCKTPLAGVGGNGKQLQWLKQHRGIMP